MKPCVYLRSCYVYPCDPESCPGYDDGAVSSVQSTSLLGFQLPEIPQEDQLNVLCDILRQIKATDRHVLVIFNGEMHNIKMTYGNKPNAELSFKKGAKDERNEL